MTPAEIAAALAGRFGEDIAVPPLAQGAQTLGWMAGRASCRRFAARPVDPALVRALCAVALCSPSKSDLQQRDIVIAEDPAQRAALAALTGQDWVAGAPAFLVFCGNNRRQRQLHDWRGHGFANDHVDALFNAAVDAGIALSACVMAAEAAGLGCCPVSTIRNRAAEASALLDLPDHVFPVAGLALGWPDAAAPAAPSMRLPLAATLHVDRFSEEGLQRRVEDYDRARAARQPYATARGVDRFGEGGPDYGWSEDKARQYALPERADFGAFLRDKGFRLE